MPTIPTTPRRPDPAATIALGEQLAASAREKRRRTSLQTCHRPAFRKERPQYRRETSSFVPQFSARVLNDPNLSDGARRCAAKLMELAYRKNRAGRSFEGTVLYLSKCLGRSERAVQTYLAQLRAGGYIRHAVVRSERARMCIGIVVTLLGPLFPKHHASEWPVKATKSGVKKDSEKYSSNLNKRRRGALIEVEHWAQRCMDGAFRALMKQNVAPTLA